MILLEEKEASYHSVQGYFPSTSQADVLNQFPDVITVFNETSFVRDVREISPKTRGFWIWMNRPVD